MNSKIDRENQSSIETNPSNIDLFELATILWDSKLFVLGCMVAGALLAGSSVLVIKEQPIAQVTVGASSLSDLSGYLDSRRILDSMSTPPERAGRDIEVANELFLNFIDAAKSIPALSVSMQSSSRQGVQLGDIRVALEPDQLPKDVLAEALEKANQSVMETMTSNFKSAVDSEVLSLMEQQQDILADEKDKRDLQVSDLEAALGIAQTAGIYSVISFPAFYSGSVGSQSEYAFLLGEKVLVAQLVSLKTRATRVPLAALRLQRQIAKLQALLPISADKRSFRYISAPALSNNRRTKVPMFVALGAFLGIMAACGILLLNRARIRRTTFLRHSR